MSIVYVGDSGTIVRLTVKDEAGSVINLSTATLKQIILQSPSNVDKVKTATLTTDGSDGKMQCTLAASDIDVKGTWHIQGYYEMPTGKWHTTTFTLVAYDPLD